VAVISLSLAPTASTSCGVTSCFFWGLIATILHTRGISLGGSSKALNHVSRVTAVTISPL
jgi:hypothetical protein